jgi:uncharacterized membrane protein
MSFVMERIMRSSLLAAAFLCFLPSQTLAQRYDYTLLPFRDATDLNNAGQVCGYEFPYGYLWTPPNNIVAFFEFDVFKTETRGMNNLGHVVGLIDDDFEPNGYTHAMRWLGSGTAEDFDPAGARYSVAIDINDAGQIVGETTVPGQPHSYRRAFHIRDADGDGVLELSERVLLPTPAGQPPGADVPVGISENNIVVGNSNYAATFWFFDSVSQSWQARMLAVPPGEFLHALGTGPAGQVVGRRSEFSSSLHAFVFRDLNGNHLQDAGELIDLPEFGTLRAAAYDMNAHGDVVGMMHGFPLYQDRAVLWRDGRIIDLSCVAGFSPCRRAFNLATAINDSGQILVTSGGQYFLLNQVSDDPTPPDQDGDYACDCADNCPFFNPDQRDRDNDGIGDACDGCRGDIDGSGVVDLTDLAVLLRHFGRQNVPYNFGDLDGDQFVNLADLSIMLINYGGRCM